MTRPDHIGHYHDYMTDEEPRYDVALSFANEDRPYVQEVADILQDSGIKVFYDYYEKANLWGRDLYSHLDFIYRKSSRYCIVFISQAYAAKVWTNHERRSIQARALEENKEYVLPARFDNTEIEGLPPTVGCVDLNDMTPHELAKLMTEKLGPRVSTPGFPRKVDRLYELLRYKGRDKKDKQKDARKIATSLYDAMRRMTADERRAVAGVFAFGCPGELPSGVHISLNLLSRKTGLAEAQLLELLRSVHSLNFRTVIRDPERVPHQGELLPDDKDLVISFWAVRAPHSNEATRVAYHATHCAVDHFCEDHGLSILVNLDFHRLFSSAKGPVIIPDDVG